MGGDVFPALAGEVVEVAEGGVGDAVPTERQVVHPGVLCGRHHGGIVVGLGLKVDLAVKSRVERMFEQDQLPARFVTEVKDAIEGPPRHGALLKPRALPRLEAEAGGVVRRHRIVRADHALEEAGAVQLGGVEHQAPPKAPRQGGLNEVRQAGQRRGDPKSGLAPVVVLQAAGQAPLGEGAEFVGPDGQHDHLQLALGRAGVAQSPHVHPGRHQILTRRAEARYALEVDVIGVAVPEEHDLAAVHLDEAAAGFRPHRHAQDQQAEHKQAEGSERTEDQRAHQKAK